MIDHEDSSRTARRSRIGALAGSTALHVVVVIALVWIARRPVRQVIAQAIPEPDHIVWIAAPGPEGGGGGSAARTPPPPKPAPPKATRTETPPAPVPITPPQIITPTERTLDAPPSTIVPIGDVAQIGVVNAPPADGGGTGSGAGPGTGAGAGPGTDRGFGGGAYQAGNGISSPVPIRRATPEYTLEAMRARAEGTIVVQCVVEPDGQCGAVRIVHSFDPPFGLDAKALECARRWRFRPGMRNGEAVPVLVNLEIGFNIR